MRSSHFFAAVVMTRLLPDEVVLCGSPFCDQAVGSVSASRSVAMHGGNDSFITCTISVDRLALPSAVFASGWLFKVQATGLLDVGKGKRRVGGGENIEDPCIMDQWCCEKCKVLQHQKDVT